MGWFSWETHGVFHCWQCSSVWNIRGLLSIVPPSNSGKCPGTSNSRRDNIEVSLGGETQTDVAEVKLVGGFNPPKKIENMWKYVKPETRKSVLGQHKQQKWFAVSMSCYHSNNSHTAVSAFHSLAVFKTVPLHWTDWLIEILHDMNPQNHHSTGLLQPLLIWHPK